MSKHHAVSVQLSITAPKGTPASIIRRAIAERCRGNDTPGIEIRIIDWRGRNGRDFDQDDAFKKLSGPILAAYVSVRTSREG